MSHLLLAQSDLIPMCDTGNRATEMLLALSVATVECKNKVGNPKSHEEYQTDCPKAHSFVCIKSKWNCRRNGKESHRLLDKGYQTKLPVDVKTAALFLPS